MATVPSKETIITAELTCGLGDLRIAHPPGTFALTPASLISIQAIGKYQEFLHGNGLDWGSGTGCLAIAAARISAVRRVIGLELSEADVATARKNAVVNGVAHKTEFFLSNSFSPFDPQDRATLNELSGGASFLVSNAPHSEGDDGFENRRIVLRGARSYLVPGGIVLLSLASPYGQIRIERLWDEVPGYTYRGLLASTDWMPFDLNLAELWHRLQLFAEEERRGGLKYVFRLCNAAATDRADALTAFAHFEQTGNSPLSQWQVHRFSSRFSHNIPRISGPL